MLASTEPWVSWQHWNSCCVSIPLLHTQGGPIGALGVSSRPPPSALCLPCIYSRVHNPGNSLNLSKNSVVKGKRGQKWTPKFASPFPGMILANSFITECIPQVLVECLACARHGGYWPVWEVEGGQGKPEGDSESSRPKEEHLRWPGESAALGELRLIRCAWSRGLGGSRPEGGLEKWAEVTEFCSSQPKTLIVSIWLFFNYPAFIAERINSSCSVQLDAKELRLKWVADEDEVTFPPPDPCSVLFPVY